MKRGALDNVYASSCSSLIKFKLLVKIIRKYMKWDVLFKFEFITVLSYKIKYFDAHTRILVTRRHT